MARFSVGARTSAGSNVLPLMSIFSSASVNFRLREVGVTNTTTTALCIGLARLATNQGTPGSGLTEFNLDNDGVTASSTAFNTHSAQGTMTLVDAGYRATIGAAAGAGFVWTFGNDVGLKAAAGTTNGVGVIIPTGSGQICDIYFVWDE
jgi:hypothetical protein